MYRIKTDIRQYKCDSVDKVEKLIRNWVIRPSDLIYLPETQRWSPIGEHPLFVRLFELLAEQERAEPETIVTDSPLEAQQEQAEIPEEDPDEVTRIKERPTFEDSDAEEVEEVEEEGREERPNTTDEDTMIGRPLSNDTVEEEAQTVPPEEPEDIEKPSRTDEVTVMTAKTLDMIITNDEEPESEEATQVTESPLAPEIQTPYEEIAQASEPDPSLSLRAPKIGRHDLPEEFFATNEISTPISREDVPPVDDLRELYGTHSVDDAWGELEPDEDLRITEQMDSPLDSEGEAERPDESADDDEDAQEDSEQEDSEQEDDEWEDDEEPVDASKIASELLSKHASRISDVYNIALPFEVGPSPEDEIAGLKRSKLSTTEKDRRFPYPSDKVISQAYTQDFDLSPPPPKDRTIVFVVGALLLFLAIIAAALM